MLGLQAAWLHRGQRPFSQAETMAGAQLSSCRENSHPEGSLGRHALRFDLSLGQRLLWCFLGGWQRENTSEDPGDKASPALGVGRRQPGHQEASSGAPKVAKV